MANKKSKRKASSKKDPRWVKPSLKYVGNVGEIFLFPGGGKVSTANYDSGDAPYKPKGQEQ
jgi:hypothetical protein